MRGTQIVNVEPHVFRPAVLDELLVLELILAHVDQKPAASLKVKHLRHGRGEGKTRSANGRRAHAQQGRPPPTIAPALARLHWHKPFRSWADLRAAAPRRAPVAAAAAAAAAAGCGRGPQCRAARRARPRQQPAAAPLLARLRHARRSAARGRGACPLDLPAPHAPSRCTPAPALSSASLGARQAAASRRRDCAEAWASRAGCRLWRLLGVGRGEQASRARPTACRARARARAAWRAGTRTSPVPV